MNFQQDYHTYLVKICMEKDIVIIFLATINDQIKYVKKANKSSFI